MMNDNLNIVKDIFYIVLPYIEEYSLFIATKLKDNFDEYLSSSSNKRDRYLTNLRNNIEKIKEKECKKINKKALIAFKEQVNEKIVLDYFNFADILTKLINLCEEQFKKSRNLKNKNNAIKKVVPKANVIIPDFCDDIELPKKRDTGVLIKDSKGKINRYFNIIYDKKKNVYKFSKDLFDLECEKFNNAILLNKEFVFDSVSDLSLFEKRRRSYILQMFEIECELKKLYNKDVNITTSVEKYFYYAKRIVDVFYDQIMNNKGIEQNYLNELQKNTVSTYGAQHQLDIYKQTVDKFMGLYKEVPSYVSKEILVESYSLKSKNDYREFRDMLTVVPLRLDIINALNLRIEEELVYNIMNYIKNIDELLDKTTMFMACEDLVKLYYNLRNALSRNSIEHNVSLKNFIKLQKGICYAIASKVDFEGKEIDFEMLSLICDKYLKEKALFS